MENTAKYRGFKFFSARSINEKLTLLVGRFPISVILVTGLTVLFFFAIKKDFDDVGFYYWMFFGIGTILSATATLFAEDLWNRYKTYGFTLLVVLLWGIYCFFLPKNVDDLRISGVIEVFVIGGAAFLAAFFISYLKKKQDRPFWNFAYQTTFYLFLAAIFGLILYGGLSLALKGIDSLFNTPIDSKLYGYLAALCLSLFSPVYFLANIPHGEAKHRETITLTRTGKILALYILTPILCVYTVILYAYLFKIIIAWELPNGWVSWLVSALGTGGLLVISLLYPSRRLEKNKVVSFLSHWFGLIILPLLVLMTIGVFRRINDYGITINRGYILLLNIWLYGIYIYLFLTQSKHIKWILISIVIVGVVSSLRIWGIAGITKKALIHEVKQTITQPVNKSEAKVLFEGLDSNKKERMKSLLEYMAKNYGMKSVQPFFTDSLHGYYWDFLSGLGLDSTFVNSNLFNYYSNKKGDISIEGLSNFLIVETYFGDNGKDNTVMIKEDSLQISAGKKIFTFGIKKSVRKYAENSNSKINNNPWIESGIDSKLYIVQLAGEYYPENDSVRIQSFSGFLFYK